MTTKEKNILVFKVDVTGLDDKSAKKHVKKVAKKLNKNNRSFTTIAIPVTEPNFGADVQHIVLVDGAY